MDSKIDIFKEEIDFTDNNDKLDKLKKSYLILKQKVCRSHDLIKLYNDKLKECERMKIDLELANKETKKMTSNYNLTLAKVIKLELQNAEYKKDIELLTNTIAAQETKMAGDRQNLQQLTCKMKEIEENHMDKIMQLDLDKSLLQENIKELKCQLKTSNKNCDSSKKKTNKKQNTDNVSESIISTADVAVNTISNVISTVDIAVNTGNDIKFNTLIGKSVMTDISCNIDKNDPFPLFCNECERILSNPYDKICRSMTKHPRLIEIISSPIKTLQTESKSSTIGKDENLANYHDSEICNFDQSVEDINVPNNNSNSSIVSLKPLKPCLTSESNNLSNITTSPNSVHVLEKLEKKMKRLEKKIKKQSRKRKELSANHLQYFPPMNCYPNNILGPNLSLNMASTFWNEVNNLVNNKQNKCVENQKKRHESKLCKFSSKKIKLKRKLRQNSTLVRNNAWNIDSIKPCTIQPMAVDDSTVTDHLEDPFVDTLSNLANNDTVLDNFSNEIKVDKDECSDTLVEENTKNVSLLSSPKKILHATDMQDDESSELSSFEDIKDNMSSSMEDTNLSDFFNDTQCYTPTVKITTEQTNDIPLTEGKCDTKSKNYLRNTVTGTTTTTTTTTTTSTNICTTNTAAINDAIMIDDTVTTTGKASTTSASAIISDKSNEYEIDKGISIPNINEISNTEFTVAEISQIYNNVPSNAKISDSMDESKLNICTTIAANCTTVVNTSPITNLTTTTMCLTSSLTTITNSASTSCRSKNTTISTGILTRAQKRKIQSNSLMDLFTVKKNNKTACNAEKNEICNDKIIKDTSDNVINNESDTLEDCTSPKKQRISNEMKILNNQEIFTEHFSTCKTTDSVTTRTNLNKSNNSNDISKVNALISKEGRSTEATMMNLSSFVTNEHEDECMQEHGNGESPKAGHSNTRTKNVDLHTKGRFAPTKASHIRLMEHLKNLRSRPPSKISDFELFRSNEPIIPDNQNNNQDKSAPQVVHNKDNELKNNEDKCVPQNARNRNSEIKNSVDKCTPQISCNKKSKLKHNEDICIPEIFSDKNREIKHNEDKSTSEILSDKNSVIKHENGCTPEIICNGNIEIEDNEDKYTPEISSNRNSEIEHNEDECTPEILSDRNSVIKHEDKCIPEIICNKNIEIEHNENRCTPEISVYGNSEIKRNEDISTPEIWSNRNSEIKLDDDKCTPEILINRNSETKHNENRCTPEISFYGNSEIKRNEDISTPKISFYGNIEIKRNEDISTPEILSNRNSEIKLNDDECTSKILCSRNNEIKNNVINTYSNMYGKEEYELQSKSVDLNIQRIDEISQQTERDLCNEKYRKNLGKNSSVANAKGQSGLQKIINEAPKFARINSISKYNRIDFVAATTTTDTAMCNESKVDNAMYDMETIAENISENSENIDNNASTSLEVMSPEQLLQDHISNKIKKPIGVRTTRKALKEMTNICKTADGFVRWQLNRILHNHDWGISLQIDVINKLCSSCPPRIIAKGIVDFMLERAMHNLDKTYTPPAPLMTSAQQRITSLLVDLEKRMPTMIKLVQAGIEYKIFRLNKTPMLHQIQNLIRLYVVLARIQKDRERVRILCCDAIYCLGLHAIPVCYAALTSWPEIFPQFTEYTEILPKCMAYIITNIQAPDFPELQPLKNLVTAYYKFKAGDYLSKSMVEELLNALEGHHSGIGVVSLKTAILLLAKHEGTFWTYKNVIQANLLPNIVNRKYSSMFEAFSLLGYLLRTFPIDDNNSPINNIIEQLSDLIESGEGSEDQQEGIISALLSLSRHNFDKIVEPVMKWTPTKPLRATTIEQYNALFTFRTSMHWKGFVRRIIHKL